MRKKNSKSHKNRSPCLSLKWVYKSTLKFQFPESRQKCILGSDMKLFGSHMILSRSDMILLGSSVQEILVLLVVVLINFGVKNQVPQISFKNFVWDLISFLNLRSDMNLFRSDLFGLYLILFGSSLKFQDPSVMLVDGLINFGVTNRVPQVFFKLATGI